MLKKTLVYAYRENKNVFALRQSNQTLLVKTGKLFDSDQTIITDKHGHRYYRNIPLESFANGFQVFSII